MNTRHVDLVALILRLALGGMFVAHGLLKLLVFSLSGTAQFFAAAGFPAWSAYPVTFIEIVGGVLMIAGLYSRWIAIVTLPILLGAVSVHWANGWLFTNAKGGWEYAAFLSMTAVALALLGDGAYSLRRLFQRNQTATSNLARG